MNKIDWSGHFNTNPDALNARNLLLRHVLDDDVDESALGPEVLKLRKRSRRDGLQYLSLTLAPEFRGTEEDLAKELNRSQDWLDDPINNLISRLEGHLFLKGDYVACTEKRTKLVDEPPYFIPVEPSSEEKVKIRQYKQDIALIREAIQTINNLRGIYK